ncbi:MAG: peptidylprolyl isomerase, partial [Deltaproteobacteria bacterium]|nr:peptidylprolyl isomerase [Deltaproteobacteria bacterium]
AAAKAAGPSDPRLLSPEKANEKAPETFKVKFKTTKGEFTVEAHREWSPNGADRLYNLATIGFFTDVAFFRAVEGFMVQFGIHGTPEVAKAWQNANIQDEPVKEGNKRARLTFAKTGLPNTRSTQMFINYGDNSRLDKMGFSAVGEVVDGMNVVDALNKEYGERPSAQQGEITRRGNAFLREKYPSLDYIQSAELVK